MSSAKAVSMISFCSTAWTLLEPDDGADIARREARRRPLRRSGSTSGSHRPRNGHGPWLAGLLLHPHEVVRVRVLLDRLAQPAVRNRVQLLDAHDRDVVTAVLLTTLIELVEQLAAHQQDPLDLAVVTTAGGELRSPSTERNLSSVKSLIWLTACLLRSIDLGVNTISGRRMPSWTPAQQVEVAGRGRRQRDRHRTSAHNCRNRSIRPEVWSGP